MRWWKRMSKTDALQPTAGWPVPYLRFIKGKNFHNNQIWFRQTFFQNQNWSNGYFGNHQVERCDVQVDVTIAGNHKGLRNFLITHDSTRLLNNNTPNTWLHYDNATMNDLADTNTEGMIFSIEYTNGTYKLDIS